MNVLTTLGIWNTFCCIENHSVKIIRSIVLLVSHHDFWGIINPNKDKRSASNNWVLRNFFQPSTKKSKILFTVSFDWSINNNVMLITKTTSTTDWFSSSFSCGNSRHKKVHKSKKIIIHDFTIHKKGSKYYTEAGCFTQVCAGLLIHKISFFLIRCFIYWA